MDIEVSLRPHELSFDYGPGVVGPTSEFRSLDSIRPTLLDPDCSGPDPVYGIAMDVARKCDLSKLKEWMLLYGVVAYASGRLGREPVRSQGHIHAIAAHSGWSPPELFQILEGRAIVYGQERAEDDPGRCVAIVAEPRDQVVIPPAWVHCVINADPFRRMVFAAWCDRQYGFIYDAVRRYHGPAWFPIINERGGIDWHRNEAYRTGSIAVRSARTYPELGLEPNSGIYTQFIENPDAISWVSNPARVEAVWSNFEP